MDEHISMSNLDLIQKRSNICKKRKKKKREDKLSQSSMEETTTWIVIIEGNIYWKATNLSLQNFHKKIKNQQTK